MKIEALVAGLGEPDAFGYGRAPNVRRPRQWCVIGDAKEADTLLPVLVLYFEEADGEPEGWMLSIDDAENIAAALLRHAEGAQRKHWEWVD